MSTLKQVAEVAGVSIGTVSHVINGAATVSEALRTRVLEAVAKLDYHPNHIARSLKRRKTSLIGIIVPDMTIPFYPQIIRGAEAAALAHGYSLIAANSGDDCKRQNDMLSLFRTHRCDGIMLAITSGNSSTPQISRTIASGIPMVCVDRVPDGLEIDSVSVDDRAAARLGVSHLISNGHQRIAMITGSLALGNERQRVAGWRKAMLAAKLTPAPDLIWESSFRVDEVCAICSEKLATCLPRPTAVFCSNGATALGVLKAFRDAGLSIPNDIAFATFDEVVPEDVFRLSLTTVLQPAYRIGYEAATILIKRIEKESTQVDPITLRFPPELRIGKSSQMAPAIKSLRAVRRTGVRS